MPILSPLAQTPKSRLARIGHCRKTRKTLDMPAPCGFDRAMPARVRAVEQEKAMRAMLEGKTVIVLGVGPAMGRATALLCANEGASVVLAARSAEQMESVADEIEQAGGGSLSVPTDMTSAPDCKRLVERAVERFGRIDGIVTVAAMPEDNLLITESPDDLANWRPIIDTNFFGTLQAVKQVIEQMLRQAGGGSIVIVNSMTSQLPWERTLPYAASKAALAAATRSLALEYGAHGIRVNGLHCGAILNDALFENLDGLAARTGSTREEVYNQIAGMNALGFIGTPEDHMGSVLYLLSDLSKPVTGISLHVNSGRFMV
jgi:NAD(P)-dependent dehydrogenase (short-subunit alcohol dehydrogenase family)